MSFDIDDLLQQPMSTIADNGFSQLVMTKVLAKQKKYQQIKASILLLSAFMALIVLYFFNFDISLQFNLFSQLQDLSHLFIGDSAMYILISLALIAITYFSIEALDTV